MLDANPTALGFALTGRMGSVRAGLSEAEAVDMWGTPTIYRLTTPPSRWWGPVAIFLGSGRRITHMGIYFEGLGGEARGELVASPISLDLVPETTPEEFRHRVSEAGGECEDATDLMYEDDAILLIRVLGSGVVAVWVLADTQDEDGSDTVDDHHLRACRGGWLRDASSSSGSWAAGGVRRRRREAGRSTSRAASQSSTGSATSGMSALSGGQESRAVSRRPPR